MLINVNGNERDVFLITRYNGLSIYKVGKARAIWRDGEELPLVKIKDTPLNVIMASRPKVKAFIEKYLECLNKPKNPPPLSFEGEGQMNSEYKDHEQKHDPTYLSGVPKWIRELKIKQLCSGPKRTFVRGIRIPQEYKLKCKEYSSLCCNCIYRERCSKPCDSPELKSSEKLSA